VKLLRALQSGEIDPVGGKQKVKVDIRLISATNQNLINLVHDGRFREDLYYRLNVFPIWVPPFRERLDDVPDLVSHFVARFAAEEGKRINGIEGDALAMLMRYSWPGNIRQLENAVFRAVVLADTDADGERVRRSRRMLKAMPLRRRWRRRCRSHTAIEGPVMLGIHRMPSDHPCPFARA
jgi:transcriptional regulator with GAF, ATPase, and Fis domain